MAIRDFPIIDWSPLAQIPQSYAQGQARAREEELRAELARGIPRGPGGEIDYGAMAALMARHGNIPGVAQFAQLGESSARAAQTASHQRVMEGIAAGNLALNRAQEERQAATAGKPRVYRDVNTGEVIREHPNGLYEIYDANRKQFVPMAPEGNAPAPVDPNIWSGPQGRIPSGSVPGPQSSLPPSLTPSEELIAGAQTAMAGGPATPMRGPQYAQAGGSPVPPPAPAPMAPSWLAGATGGAAGGGAPPAVTAGEPLPPPPPNLTPKQLGEWNSNMIRLRAQAAAATDKALPAEQASRIGMASKFLAEVPFIRERAAAGELSGVGAVQAYLNAYGPGELARKIKSGTDALLRTLTGAGMPHAEAVKYVARYEPEKLETSRSMVSKLDQLEAELKAIEWLTFQGRGGVPRDFTDARAAAAEGLQAIKAGRNKKIIMQRLKNDYGISFEFD